MSNQIKDTIRLDLHHLTISGIPMTDPDELEDVLINAADKLTDGNEPIILEALMNVLVDYYVFTLKPGDDDQDIGFLVSNIEDKVCDAIAFRKTLIDNGLYDTPEVEVSPSDTNTEKDEVDDENEDLPQPIKYERYIEDVETPIGTKRLYKIRCPTVMEESSQEPAVSDSDDIRDKDIPGMMKRFESDGFEITVKMVPKKEFD